MYPIVSHLKYAYRAEQWTRDWSRGMHAQARTGDNGQWYASSREEDIPDER
jgi:hypothetical protein